MTTPFCTDVDLLHWEPTLLRDATFASQTLMAGTGSLAGNSFTISDGSFTTAGVSSNQVIVIGGAINGCFPILAVTSATLSVSVLYDQLDSSEIVTTGFVGDVGPATAASFPYSVRTFWPQRIVVSELLMQAAGVGNARANETPATIVNIDVLRRPCTLGTLQMIYSALAAAAGEDAAHYQVRADLYEKLYRRALRSTKVDIDLDGDGFPEVTRALNVLDLQRA